MTLPPVNWLPLLPLLILTGTALFVLVADLVVEGDREVLAWPSLAGLGATAGVSALLWGATGDSLGGVFRLDTLALYGNLIFCAGTALAILLAVDTLAASGVRSGEAYALFLFAAVGMVAMAGATDLIVLFLGLEVMSIAVYVMAGLQVRELRSNEAALKYFLLGAFATGFLLFGIALLYAATGTTRLDGIAEALGQARVATPTLVQGGIVLILVGFAFKVAAAPFHVWTPDVYEGSPISVTAFMAVAVKAAAFVAFARVFLGTLGVASPDWVGIAWVLAALTMTVGNVLAITQSSLKRMLAYSSIAHAGVALVGLVAGGEAGGASMLFYLFAYTLMNVGAFAVVGSMAARGEAHERIDDLAGLGFRRPFYGVAMSVFMLSLAGVPPMMGFVGKFLVFRAAVTEGFVGLAVIGVVNSVVGAYYYLWVIVTMYMREGGLEPVDLSRAPWLATAIGTTLAATILLGLFPGPVIALSQSGFSSLF